MGKILDGLTSLVANLGTGRDKAATTFYAADFVPDQQLLAAYSTSWISQKLVDIPATDACRKWRNWQAEAAQISAIEAEESRLGLISKVERAMINARLLGECYLYIGTGDQDPSKPLSPESVKKGGIKHLTLIGKNGITAGDIDRNPESEYYNKPSYYTLDTVTIHPSRLVIFIGKERPAGAVGVAGQGDSVLQSAMSAVKNADAAVANIASLLFEAKIDVIKIPNLMDQLSDACSEEQVLKRFQLAMMMKGINGTLVLDSEEEYEQKNASFANLDNLMYAFMQVVSGAADIPMIRFLSQSAGGLNSSGDNDIRNYYDRIQSEQKLVISPALTLFDECLIRSALGSRPAEIFYMWAPLWQVSEKERADIGKITAETIKILADTRLIPDDALTQSAVNMLTEAGVAPGLEREMMTAEADDPNAEDAGTVIVDAAPRTLYVSRKVVNTADILKWAKEQGIPDIENDLHVTIAYSTTPVDWMKVGQDWDQDENGHMTIEAGGARLMDVLGEARVLLFSSSRLAWRNESIRESGASWDWPDYQPHITMTYADFDISKVEPYRGKIVLGPEVFEEIRA